MPQAVSKVSFRQSFLIALGANEPSAVGSPQKTLMSALDRLAARGVEVCKVSAFYGTPAFPAGNGPDYVNAAAEVAGQMTAEQLLAEMHALEAEFGRSRRRRWASRPLDLDLLAAGAAVLPNRQEFERWMHLPADAQATESPQQMILPHPRLQERAFVLVPLCDVAPDWTHPVLGKTVAQMRARLPKEALEAVKTLEAP